MSAQAATQAFQDEVARVEAALRAEAPVDPGHCAFCCGWAEAAEGQAATTHRELDVLFPTWTTMQHDEYLNAAQDFGRGDTWRIARHLAGWRLTLARFAERPDVRQGRLL